MSPFSRLLRATTALAFVTALPFAAHAQTADGTTGADAEKYPTLSFKSTKVEKVGNDNTVFKVTGPFTMHGVTKTISFPFTVSGPVVDGFGYTRGGIKAKFDINRQDYGVKWNQLLDNGGLAVDNIVHINLELEAVKAGTGPKQPA